MNEIVGSLSDDRARKILETIAEARIRRGGQAIELDYDLARALTDVRVLAEEPGTAEAIATMAEHTPEGGEKFVEPGTIALATAVIIALQTHIRIEYRRSPGRRTIRVTCAFVRPRLR